MHDLLLFFTKGHQTQRKIYKINKQTPKERREHSNRTKNEEK